MEPFRQLAAQGAMIEQLSSDSRRCAPGVAFLAYPGEAADGRAHITDALGRDAAAVVWEEAGFAWRDEWRVPNVAVRDLKQHAGNLAHEFYGRLRGAVDVRRHRTKARIQQQWSSRGSARTAQRPALARWVAVFPRAGGSVNDPRFFRYTRAEDLSCAAPKGRRKSLPTAWAGRGRGACDCALFNNISPDHLDIRQMELTRGEGEAVRHAGTRAASHQPGTTSPA